MSAIVTTSGVLDEALRGAGLEEAFDDRGIAHEDCPGCGAVRGLKLSLARGRVQCSACGSEGPLLAYLREKSEASDWNNEPFSEAEIISIEPRLQSREPDTELVPGAIDAVIGYRLCAGPGAMNFQVILQVLADPRHFVMNFYAVAPELGSRADT